MNSAAIGRFVTKVRRSIPLPGLVDVLLTTNKEMKALNQRFRSKNEATDVLSFPADGTTDLAGEIAISLEIARENAHLLGHSTADETKILVLHGMLHLAGYDHENDHGEMFRKEQRLREVLNLPAGLIERNEPRLQSASRKRANLATRSNR